MDGHWVVSECIPDWSRNLHTCRGCRRLRRCHFRWSSDCSQSKICSDSDGSFYLGFSVAPVWRTRDMSDVELRHPLSLCLPECGGTLGCKNCCAFLLSEVNKPWWPPWKLPHPQPRDPQSALARPRPPSVNQSVDQAEVRWLEQCSWLENEMHAGQALTSAREPAELSMTQMTAMVAAALKVFMLPQLQSFDQHVFQLYVLWQKKNERHLTCFLCKYLSGTHLLINLIIWPFCHLVELW